MEELRKLAHFTAFESAEKAFKKPVPRPRTGDDVPPPPPLPNIISIRNGDYTPYSLTSNVSEDRLLQLGTHDGEVDGHASGPTLEMAIVARMEDDSIDLSRNIFNGMIQNMKIDPIVLQHVYLSSYGFYHYGDCDDEESFDNGTRTFFFGNFLFSVVWSFDIKTEKTSAIVLLRIIPRHFNGTLPLMALNTSLQTYMNHFKSPLSLAFILHATLAHVVEENLGRIVKTLRSVEQDTEHGPSSGDNPAAHQHDSTPYGRQASSVEKETTAEAMERQDTGLKELKANENLIEALTEVAKKLADVNVHLANMDRHAKLLKSMAKTLKDESFRKLYCRSDGNGKHADCAEHTNYFVRTLAPLCRRLEGVVPTIEYLQGRAKGQHQVVSAL